MFVVCGRLTRHMTSYGPHPLIYGRIAIVPRVYRSFARKVPVALLEGVLVFFASCTTCLQVLVSRRFVHCFAGFIPILQVLSFPVLACKTYF